MSTHTHVDTEDHSHNQSYHLRGAYPVQALGFTCIRSLSLDNMVLRTQVVMVLVSLF